VPEIGADFGVGWKALESEVCDVQGLQEMELGGFEPPTSWVRFRLLVAEELRTREAARGGKWLTDAEFPALPSASETGRVSKVGIRFPADMRRLSAIQAQIRFCA
jgi:hypothetical protein